MENHKPRFDSDLLDYILARHSQPGDRLPALGEIGAQLGISIGKLREQLEAARLLGLVEVRTHVGMRVQAYRFLPAVRASLMFALAQTEGHFEQFSELRNSVEAGFWRQAAERLTESDKADLQTLVAAARAKLSETPIRIPPAEHRALHLAIFRRLDNPFVLGLLEAYWEAYEAVGLNVFADLHYHQEVWDYHDQMVQAILSGDTEAGHRAFVEHTHLLRQRDTKELSTDEHR